MPSILFLQDVLDTASWNGYEIAYSSVLCVIIASDVSAYGCALIGSVGGARPRQATVNASAGRIGKLAQVRKLAKLNAGRSIVRSTGPRLNPPA